MQKATLGVTWRKQRVDVPDASREVEPPQGRSGTSTHTLRRWHLRQADARRSGRPLGQEGTRASPPVLSLAPRPHEAPRTR